MKIAYIFHGHSRTWQYCYTSFFNNLYSVAPGDIFIHTWDRVNSTNGSNWSEWKKLEGKQFETANRYADITGIIQTYKPKAIIVEQHPEVDISWVANPNVRTLAEYGVRYMFQGINKIYEESKRHDNYDYYINIRMDIEWYSKLNINELRSDKLLCSNWIAWDCYMCGPKHLMDIRAGLYHDIDNYWYKSEVWPGQGYEDMLELYLKEKGIRRGIELIPCSLAHRMVRFA